jgi:stress response protein SCP2
MSVPPPIVIQPSLIQQQMTQLTLTQNNSFPAGVIPHKRGDAFQPGNWIEIQEPKINMGFGWDFHHGTETFDLDSSVTGFDLSCGVIESICFNDKRGLEGSVIHSGDINGGNGDDGMMEVDLNRVPVRIRFLAVTVNSFEKNSLIGVKCVCVGLFADAYRVGKCELMNDKGANGILL